MKLHKALIRKLKAVDGLSMIETLVVIGIFSILILIGLFLGMDVWRGSSFQSEQDIVLSLLFKARSRAISNINESNHGLFIQAGGTEYVLFEGSSHAAATETVTFDRNQNLSFGASDIEVIFAARTGTLPASKFFTMDGQGKTRNFAINEEGGITWN